MMLTSSGSKLAWRVSNRADVDIDPEDESSVYRRRTDNSAKTHKMQSPQEKKHNQIYILSFQGNFQKKFKRDVLAVIKTALGHVRDILLCTAALA
jgi:hypothetical protein